MLYGFDEDALKMLKSYLSNRKQCVCIDGTLSNLKELKDVSVPQGSILGPILYIIFSNDLPEIIHNHPSDLNQNDSDLNIGPETPRKTSLFKREQALLKHSNTESQKSFKRPMLIYTTPRVWDSKGTRSVVASPVNRLGILNNVNSSLNGSEILKNIL